MISSRTVEKKFAPELSRHWPSNKHAAEVQPEVNTGDATSDKVPPEVMTGTLCHGGGLVV